jgi:5-methylcytosine-specific restriction endonuclease McrA
MQKLRPIRLEREQYEELRRAILQRDGWRCQFCGVMTSLEVHHLQFRSHSGKDREENLIVLCRLCHKKIHGERA